MENWRKQLAAGLLAFILILVVAGCGGRTNDRISVVVKTAAEGDVNSTQEITGTLAPAQAVNIFSKLSGQVKSVLADVGDTVQAGELLLQIDTKELNAQLRQAEAAVRVVRDQADQARIAMESARINLDLAQKTYDRIKILADTGAVSQSQFDDAQNKLDLARKQYESAQKQYAIATGSAMEQAQAAVNTVQVQISNSEITSPITGVVTNRNINPGEVAAPGVPLLTLADTANLRLQGTVSEALVPLLSVGQEIKIAVDVLPGRVFKGEIARIGPVAATTGQYFPIDIKIKNPGELKAGMTARVDLQVNMMRGIVVPLSAVKTDNGHNYVFVVKQDGTVKKRLVTLGPKNESRVIVVSGLKKGERVAVSNVRMLQDGMKVVQRS